MTENAHPTRYLIRGGRIYDHDGDIHQPTTADLLIRGGIIDRIEPQIAADDGSKFSILPASSWCQGS